jgi:predicted RNA-binding protein YlxR (DUF448 family)
MPRRNHRPRRTCLGCQGRDDQMAMVRLTMLGEALVLDDTIRRGGRGGYLHPTECCLRKFVRSRVREFRSFRRVVSRDERSRIAELLRGASA